MLRESLWGDDDPYAQTPDGPSDPETFRVNHPVLWDAIADCRIIAEIGVWKGRTAIAIAKRSGAEVLAVDHFRGSAEHFANPQWRGSLAGLYDTFRRNVLNEGLEAQITPLPLDSRAAWEVCVQAGLRFDLVHIDGAHDYGSVYRDISLWAGLTDRIVMDDYSQAWPDVLRAAKRFMTETQWRIVAERESKALLVRNEQNQQSDRDQSAA